MNSQTLTFRDGTDQWDVGPDRVSDYTRYMTPNSDVSLQNFFERPILTQTYTWTPGVTPFFQDFDPWLDFFSNKRNINRLNNFYILNCSLNVKILINGNPFYYGRLMADYVPLPFFDKVTDSSGSTTTTCIGASQRLHGYIDPALSQGCTLKLPFVYGDNGIDIVNGDFDLLGKVNIREMNPLKHANGSATPVTINVFVWASDVSISIPTTANSSTLVAQASEIDLRPSTIASATSGIMAKLSNVPTIGPYAMATSMIFGGLGKLAKLFGYSRPCIVDAPQAMRPSYVGELACVDKKENVVKLTADSRQEVTIDPSVIGVSVPDELSVAYIAGKESYLTNFGWPVASTEGTLLWNTRVGVNMSQIVGSSYFMTALCFASLPFTSWRGTLKYRFQIVASAYHKGRILFMYDPLAINGVETNIAYSRVIDLEKERDITIDVAWGQPSAYLPVQGLGANAFTTSAAYTANQSYNGVLGVYVLNSLTSPNSTINNDISINVFVSACDDIDFVEPTSQNIRSIALVTQADMVDIPVENAPTSMECDECMSETITKPDIHKVFYGEAFPSFRALLKRYVLHSSHMAPTTAVGKFSWFLRKPDYPVPRGIVTSGGMNNAGLANYNVTTLLNYLTPAFCAQRGGIRYKYIFKEDGTISYSNSTIVRVPTVAYSSLMSARVETTTDAYMKAVSNSYQSYVFNAAAITVNQRQPVIELELPFYKRKRFCHAKDPAGTASNSNSPVLNNGHVILADVSTDAVTDRATIDCYVSVAEDFQLMWFQGCPPVYIYTIP